MKWIAGELSKLVQDLPGVVIAAPLFEKRYDWAAAFRIAGADKKRYPVVVCIAPERAHGTSDMAGISKEVGSPLTCCCNLAEHSRATAHEPSDFLPVPLEYFSQLAHDITDP